MITYLIVGGFAAVASLILLGLLPEESIFWFFGGIAVLGGLDLLRDLPAVWRGDRDLLVDDPYRIPEWWPLGDALWRAVPRTSAIEGPGAIPFGIVGPLLMTEASTSGPLAVVEVICLVVLAIDLVLAFTIALLNQPKFLVPPHLRHFPGALAEWFEGAPVPEPPPADQRPGERIGNPRSRRR